MVLYSKLDIQVLPLRFLFLFTIVADLYIQNKQYWKLLFKSVFEAYLVLPVCLMYVFCNFFLKVTNFYSIYVLLQKNERWNINQSFYFRTVTSWFQFLVGQMLFCFIFQCNLVYFRCFAGDQSAVLWSSVDGLIHAKSSFLILL